MHHAAALAAQRRTIAHALRGEIEIVPHAIEPEPLVEARRAQGRPAHAHIAAIDPGEVDVPQLDPWRHVLTGAAIGGDDRAGALARNATLLDTVCEHMA